MSTMARDLERSLLAPLVLASLEDREYHGWGLLQRLDELKLAPAKQGTLYPLLTRLEEQGSVASAWAIAEGARPRRYYSITAKGASELAAFRARWAEISRGVAMFNEKKVAR